MLARRDGRRRRTSIPTAPRCSARTPRSATRASSCSARGALGWRDRPDAGLARRRALRDRRPHARSRASTREHVLVVVVSAPWRQAQRPRCRTSHRELGARSSTSAAGTCRCSTPPARSRSTRRARGGRPVRRLAHGRGIPARRRRARGGRQGSRRTRSRAAPVGKAVYTLLCHAERRRRRRLHLLQAKPTDEFFVIVNASNTAKDLAWFRDHATGTACNVDDVSEATALIAVQGPKAVAMVDGARRRRASPTCRASRSATRTVAGVDVHGRAHRLHRRGRLRARVRRAPTRSRCGAALLEAATPLGGLPVGLGARDTLRLESKLPLYGNDLDDDHTPLEAGLGWAVKLDNREFIGAAALRAQKAGRPRAPARRLHASPTTSARSRATATRSSTPPARRSAS